MERPNINWWPSALQSLTLKEIEFARSFFPETDRYFQAKLSELRAEADQEGPASDDDVEWFIGLRDELEGYGHLNRYFAIVQAHSVVEQVFSRIVETAIDYGILQKKPILGTSRFPNANAIRKGFKDLGIALPAKDNSAWQALACKRHTILHHGGWYEPQKTKKGEAPPIRRLEFKKSDVESALNLAVRCAKSALTQYHAVLNLRFGPPNS